MSICSCIWCCTGKCGTTTVTIPGGAEWDQLWSCSDDTCHCTWRHATVSTTSDDTLYHTYVPVIAALNELDCQSVMVLWILERVELVVTLLYLCWCCHNNQHATKESSLFCTSPLLFYCRVNFLWFSALIQVIIKRWNLVLPCLLIFIAQHLGLIHLSDNVWDHCNLLYDIFKTQWISSWSFFALLPKIQI